MKMQVSHECPIPLLEDSLQWNDYAYALVHLFEEHEDYYNFFHKAKLYDKEVYLDNSIFELGTSFDPAKYSVWIERLEPNVYIVPDVLEDAIQARNKFQAWLKDYNNVPGRKMGVVQGKTYNELVECYKYMSDNADMIAISFDYSYYQTTGLGNTKLERYCSGRQRLVNQLIQEGHWEWNKPHHLLGCSLAREFRYYVNENIYNIRSCDTSNPIVAGIHKLKYDFDLGLTTKPSTKLVEYIEYAPDQDQLDHIAYNVKMFKRILNREEESALDTCWS